MIYLSRFTLTSVYDEEEYINNFPRNCYDSYYPFNFFPQIKRLESMKFSDITILCGSNGSGKSTLLNIIAEKRKGRPLTTRLISLTRILKNADMN